jgi:hypothetical protein
MAVEQSCLRPKGISILSGEKRGYKSYLLRLWETSEKGQRVWRASLEPPGSRQRQGFASLEALFAYLEEQTDRPTRYHEENNE